MDRGDDLASLVSYNVVCMESLVDFGDGSEDVRGHVAGVAKRCRSRGLLVSKHVGVVGGAKKGYLPQHIQDVPRSLGSGPCITQLHHSASASWSHRSDVLEILWILNEA